MNKYPVKAEVYGKLFKEIVNQQGRGKIIVFANILNTSTRTIFRYINGTSNTSPETWTKILESSYYKISIKNETLEKIRTMIKIEDAFDDKEYLYSLIDKRIEHNNCRDLKNSHIKYNFMMLNSIIQNGCLSICYYSRELSFFRETFSELKSKIIKFLNKHLVFEYLLYFFSSIFFVLFSIYFIATSALFSIIYYENICLIKDLFSLFKFIYISFKALRIALIYETILLYLVIHFYKTYREFKLILFN